MSLTKKKHALLLHPTMTAQWQALLNEAQQHCAIALNEELESYLVFLLIRFTECPELAKSVLGLEFLDSLQSQRRENQLRLKEVGDKCLLYAGLFPDHASRRRLTVNYFVNLGKTAYSTLSSQSHKNRASLFSALCQQFILMTDVLNATRDAAGQNYQRDLFQALECWTKSNSQYSFDILKTQTNSLPISPDKDDSSHEH